MSTVATAPVRRSGAAPVKKTLDREHARLSPTFDKCDDERKYYEKTAHILFHYYESIDKGASGSSPGVTTPSEPARVGSHKVTVGLKQKSVLDFINLKEDPAAATSAALEDDIKDPEFPGEERTPVNSEKSASKYAKMSLAELLDSFMRKVDSEYAPEPDKADPRYMRKSIAEVSCPHCGGPDRVLVPNDGFLHCLDCDTIEYVTLDSERPSYRDPPRELSYFCYKRSNHLQEWLSQTQGREYTNIPDCVYDAITVELKKQKFTNLAKLTRKKLHEVMKKLNLNKWYEHESHILNSLSGKPSLRIPPHTEAQFKRMFAQIQVPFMKHSPPNRKNMISYSFCLSRFADLLGYDEIQEYLPKLKSKTKRQEQNKIWECICQDLGWEFNPIE